VKYSALNYTVTLKLGFGVTQGHLKWHYSIEQIDFVFVFNSNYASIYYRFRDIAAYWSKIASFCYPLVFGASVGGEAVRVTQQPLVTKT